MAGVGSITYNGKDYECLLLHQGGLQAQGWLRVGLAMVPAANAIHVITGHGVWTRSVDLEAQTYVIPVGYFKAWKSGTLSDEVRKRAPQAFKKDEKTPEN